MNLPEIYNGSKLKSCLITGVKSNFTYFYSKVLTFRLCDPPGPAGLYVQRQLNARNRNGLDQ